MSNSVRFISLLAALVLAGPATLLNAQAKADPSAQEQREKEDWVGKIFEVKHGDAVRLTSLASLLASVFRGDIKPQPALMAITVRAPKEIMPAIEDAIKRFDVPPPPQTAPKNIELMAYLLLASEPESNVKLPAELQPVIKQVKTVFPYYQGFRLLDTLVLRSREGKGGEMSGVAPTDKSEAALAPTIYQFKFGSVRITSDEKGRVVWVDGLRLGARIPLRLDGRSFNYQDIGIVADVDVREGQKVVVGKSSIGGQERTLFMVVTAKVVD